MTSTNPPVPASRTDAVETNGHRGATGVPTSALRQQQQQTDQQSRTTNPQSPTLNANNNTNDDNNNINTSNDDNSDQQSVQLYKSTRLKGYITLAVASFINYDAALKSNSISGRNHVPATNNQRQYAIAASLVTFIVGVAVIGIHLDRFTPLKKIWLVAFKVGSRIELSIVLFLVLWWTIAVAIQTTVDGIAGDGKGQYSLFYSSWACCLTCYWILERWWVAAGLSSLKSFISSWPNRAPAWMVIMVLSFLTLIWFVDLRASISNLVRPEEMFIREYFDNIPDGHWQLLSTVTSVTMIPSFIFVFIELFRDSRDDGTIQSKTKIELIIEGICFLVITILWIPTVMIATTPGGPASLIGNTYFFTWLLVVFVFEGVVWFIHDVRKEQHQALRRKEDEYRRRQQRVLEQSRAIQQAYHNNKIDKYVTRRNINDESNQQDLVKTEADVNADRNYTINDWDDSAMMKDNTVDDDLKENRRSGSFDIAE